MKTIKRLFSVVITLALVMTTALSTIALADPITTEGYYTYLFGNSGAVITDVNTNISGDVVIPSTLGGYTVTSIGYSAFYWCDSLESIEIPDSVTTIGERAFEYCESLENITIPDSVTSIGSDAFAHTAYYRDENNWENGVLYIGKHLIEAKEDISGDYSIKEGTKTIAGGAFADCYSLESIEIPDSVTTIGERAFYWCYSLENIEIPDSVTTIGERAFSDTAYYDDENNWENGVLYIGKHLIEADDFSGDYSIKEGTITIADHAFYNCESLKSVTIPDSVTEIGEFAFNYCTNLASIIIPDSVTTIGERAFEYCESLESIVIPDSVTTIGEYAFYCCGLENIVISNGVKTIGDGAFKDCANLRSITIPDSVTTIGDEAFNLCSSLESIEIPDSVISIDYSAFRNTAYYRDESNWENGVLYIGKHLIEAYDISGKYSIKKGTKTIANDAFYWCESLRSITIPDSVTTIGKRAFYNCDSLKSVTIPSSVTTIGNCAFGYYMDEVSYDNKPLPRFTIYGCVNSVAEKYAVDNGFEFIEFSYEDLFTFDAQNSIVTGVEAGLSANDITSEVIDKNGNTLASDALIGTGCTITKDGKEYTVIVSGDSSGDGKVNSTDFMQVRRQYLGLFSMNTAQSLAADVTGDDNINSTDFTRIRRHFLGLYDLYA